MADYPRVNRKNRYDDTFKRKTVWIEEPLLERIQELASNRKGEQTRIINAALHAFLFVGGPKEYHDPIGNLMKKTFYFERRIAEKLEQLSGGGRQQAIINMAVALYLADPKNVAKHEATTDWYADPNKFWRDITIQRMDD